MTLQEKRAKHAAYERERRKKFPENIRETNRKQYEKNKVKNREYSKKYYQANKRRCLDYQAIYRDAYSPRLLAKKAEYYVKNKQELQKKKRRYGQENVHKIAEASRSRQARKRGLTPVTASKRFMLEFYRTARRLTKCLGIAFHVDHIVPLARGGKHEESNLQVIPGAINVHKHTKIFPPAFLAPDKYQYAAS
jgi:5-methylcytosine-specific restriction endonuclease McrA